MHIARVHVRSYSFPAGNLLHGQANIVYHKKMLELVERLQQIVKISNDDRYFFSNRYHLLLLHQRDCHGLTRAAVLRPLRRRSSSPDR